MSVALPLPVPESYSLRRRLFLAVAILLAAGSFALVTLAQPPVGTVTGVCTDASLGTPLADVQVNLSRHSDADSDTASDTPTDQNALGDASVPVGWKQDSRDDSQTDSAGASQSPRDEFQTHSDAQGCFTLKHVPTGEYDVYYVSSSGHHLAQTVSVVVTDNQIAHLALPLERDKPSLRFINAGRNWTPEESVAVSLNGLLQTRSVQFSIDRLDVAGTLARRPADLTHLDGRDSDSSDGTRGKSLGWPGQFTPMHHWTYALTKSDPEGAFTEHISLGALPLGLYRITARSGEDGQTISATSWALVTRLALVRKMDGHKLLAWVTDITTGRPQANISLALYDQGEKASKLLGQARTSPDGTARLVTTGALPESEGALVARQGNSLVALSLDLNSPGDEGSGPSDTADEAGGGTAASVSGRMLRSFIYSDRPVYRPGQTVALKGIGRWFDAQHGFRVPANQRVTLDVRDAQDTLITHQQVTTNDMGSWNATLALSPEALTGEYSVKTQLGTETCNATFNVAAYQKPEYQAAVTFTKDRYIHGEPIEATVTATYFYGAPVSGGKAHIYVTRGDARADGESAPSSSEETSDSGEPLLDENIKLDGNGQANVRIPTRDQPDAEGDQPFTVNADIEDASQRSVEAKGTTTVAQGLFSLEVTPSARNARPGTPLSVTLHAGREAGAAQAGQDIELETGYRAYGTDDKETWTRVSDTHVRTASNGEATAAVTAPRTGDLVCRASARDVRGNKITAEDDVWVVGDGEDIAPAHLPDLSLTLDRDKYTPGQTARLLINTAHPGPSALVTVEGRTLSRTLVVSLMRHATAVDLVVTADDAPSVTVKVCCIRDKRYQESVDHLVVSDQHRGLQIAVIADKKSYHPGDPATIQILTRDTEGRPAPAEVSVAVVDSAIYAIQPEAPLTIAEAMLPDQGNHVQTDNSCPEVFLGDVDKGATSVDIRRKFPDTALWKPDVRTGLDGRATVSLDVPDTLTTWRITCVGHTLSTEVGKGVGTMTVAKDLLVRLESPPFLTAGDTETVAALVHNNTGTTVHAQVRLAASGLSVQGDASRQADVPPGEPVRLTWTVSAPAQPLPAKLQVTAQAGGLSDGVEQTLSVVPHGAMQDQWHSGTLLRRISKDVTLDPQAIPGSTTLRVRLAPSVASALLPAVDYLASYPYGSTDATVSAFVPDVLLADSTRGLGLSAAQRAGLRDKVGRSLLRLARFQNSDGGWGWFPTDRGDLYMTAYAAWGLTLARDAGYQTNPTVLDAAASQLKSLTGTTHWIPSSDSRFSLAALALAGLGKSAEARTVIHSLERARATHPERVTPTDLALGALAAHRLGPTDEGTAQTLMRALWAVVRQTGSFCSWTSSAHRSPQGVAEDMPDSSATAWGLLAALAVTPADPRVDAAARWLMANRSDDHWAGPSDTAVAVLGLTQFMARSHELQPDFNARLLLNGKIVRQLHFGPDSLVQPDRVIALPGAALNPGVNTFSLEKDGPGRLYYTADLKQCLRQPSAPPAPTLLSRLAAHIRYPHGAPLPPAPSGYRIKRVYLRMTTRRNFLWEDTVPAPDTTLNAGESILVRLIIQCTRPASRVVIQEPVPAGCRIAEVSGDNAAEWEHWWNFTDVRDDRLVFFVSDLTRGEHEIDYHLQAQTAGAYDVMPTLLTSMVDPTLYALGAHADRIQIDPRG